MNQLLDYKTYLNLRLHYLKYLLQFMLLSFRVKGSSIDLYVEPQHISYVLLLLKNHTAIKANNLLDITVIDEVNMPLSMSRYRCIYTLLSVTYNIRINIHTHTAGKISTVTHLYSNAD